MAGRPRAPRISYHDRALRHPAVICTAMVCASGVVIAGMRFIAWCLDHRYDPLPLLQVLEPGAVVAAVLGVVNSAGALLMRPMLQRIERNTGLQQLDEPPTREPWEQL